MEIIGHQKEFALLKKSFEENHLSHAYLFSGQEHLGKKTLALEFIKLINCKKSPFADKPRTFSALDAEGIKIAESSAEKVRGKACEKCISCKAFLKNWHPDLILISNEENESIQISQIRKIQYFLSQTAFLGSYKSVIIDHAERMTKDAQSCLLKTLEEPKGKTLLILISSFPNLIMKTITSRCQKICFLAVPSQILANFLDKQGQSLRDSHYEKEKLTLRLPLSVNSELAEELIFSFQGRPGKLINFLLNPEKLEKENQILKEILNLSKRDLYSRFQYIKSLENENILTNEIIKILTEYFRYLLIGQFNKSLIEGQLFKENYSLSKLKEILEFLNEVYFLISFTNINKKLALEMLMMKL